MAFPLTGIDPTNPLPGDLREIRFAQGAGGGVAEGREAVIYCSLNANGTGTVETLYGPITDRQEVIDRFGYNSEGLLLHDTFRAYNKTTPLYMIAASVAGSAPTRQYTFATSATANTSVKIRHIGEVIEVAVAEGDDAATVHTAVAAAVNNQKHWTFTATDNTSNVTLTSSTKGIRFDHYLQYTNMYFSKDAGMTVTQGSVSSGSTDDDQTTALAAVGTKEIYYQINPKTNTGDATATDNGLGEHSAQITSDSLPSVGRDQVLIFGAVSTNANAASVAGVINNPLAFCVWAENNDYSPGMLAARYASVKALKEATHPGANLTSYGQGAADQLHIPAPYTDTDRPTYAEKVVALNNGVTPIDFLPNGRSFILRDVTTYSDLGTSKDYRVREGHIPSVMAYFSQVVRSAWLQAKRQFVADDPADGEKPPIETNTPKDLVGIIRKEMDNMVNYGGGPILDPSVLEEMKASVEVERLPDGLSARCAPVAVKHNNRSWMLFNQSGPSL